MIEIELLSFDGCPSWHRAWSDLGTVLAEMKVDAAVHLRDVLTLDEGARTGFAGSPSVRVDGIDLAGYGGPGVIACRRYDDDAGLGWPSVQLLRTRLRPLAQRQARTR
jgi:hypothetical protein